MYEVVSKMDSVVDNVEEKIDDQGLSLASVKRAMERLHEANRKEWESFRDMEKKMDGFSLLLRRIMGFQKDLEVLSDQQEKVSKGVQDLVNLAFPPDNISDDDDDDETGTQYDNDDNTAYYPEERLGNGPPPTLFPVHDDRNPAVKGLNVPSSSGYIGPTVPKKKAIIAPSDPVISSVPLGPVDTSGPVASSGPVDSSVPSDPVEMGPIDPDHSVEPSAAPPSPVEPVLPISPLPVPAPDITMTTPTPMHSQDDDQATTKIASSSTLAPPPGQPSQPPSRRSPRIRGNSQAPTFDLASKRPPEDEDGGNPKRRKVAPS